MKTYKITFNDEIEANSEEEAYDKLLEWMKDCVKYEDVTTFDFEEVVRMNTQQNIIERLQDAANIMHEHAQYNDEESEHNGEGLAAETCEDAVALMKRMLADIEGVRHLLRKIEKYLPPDDEGRQLGEWIDDLNETIALTKVKY